MKHFLNLKDLSLSELHTIFSLASNMPFLEKKSFFSKKTFALFFPTSSIRTRVTFEKAIYQLGAQSILFPPDALETRENLKDMTLYLNNWIDCLIIRYPDMKLLEELASYSPIPIINAMTNHNHPCEVLSDLYSLSQISSNFLSFRYLYVGPSSNIGNTWKEASTSFNLSFSQCCPPNFELENVHIEPNLLRALKTHDVIITDSISPNHLSAFEDYQITLDLLNNTQKKLLLNPCPPFHRGEEVSSEAIDSPFFVGYSFKQHLLTLQQALIYYLFNS